MAQTAGLAGASPSLACGTHLQDSSLLYCLSGFDMEPVPQVGPYDHTKRAPAKGSTLGFWQAEEGLKAADFMLQQPSQHQLPPVEERQHPGRPVEAVGGDKGEDLVQESSVADGSNVAEDEEEYADVEGDAGGARGSLGVPALQLAESSAQVGLLCSKKAAALGCRTDCHASTFCMPCWGRQSLHAMSHVSSLLECAVVTLAVLHVVLFW